MARAVKVAQHVAQPVAAISPPAGANYVAAGTVGAPCAEQPPMSVDARRGGIQPEAPPRRQKVGHLLRYAGT
eukprot:COSAG01_NODE_2895_length_6901_cov_35.009262_1_plen_71_part_10